MKLFFSKEESPTKDTPKVKTQESESPVVENIEEAIQIDEIPVEKIEEKRMQEVELVTPNETESNSETIDESKKEQKSDRWNTWKFEKTLTNSQKVIFSLSVFAVLLVISFAMAESFDEEMKMSETWFIWVGFIVSQAWLQNKFWNSGLSFELKARKPDTSKLNFFWTKHRKKFFVSVAVFSVLVVLGFCIDPFMEYLHERELKKLAQPITLPAKSNMRFINTATAIIKYEEGSIFLNLLIEIKDSKSISVNKLKLLHQFIESKNAEQVVENPIEETVVYYTEEEVWNPSKRYNKYLRGYEGGWETQRTPHYKKKLKMTYINKPLVNLDDREDFIREYVEESSFHKLFNLLKEVGYYNGNYSTFYASYADNTPDKLEVNFNDIGGFEIVGCYFQKSTFNPLVSDKGELVSYSYSGKFCESSGFTKDDYKKIKDWNIEWKD